MRKGRRTSNRPFSFVKIWEIFRGRNRARANSCPGKILANQVFCVNFLLIIFTVPFCTGVGLCTRGRTRAAGDRPLVQPQASYTPGTWELLYERELQAAPATRAAYGRTAATWRLRLEIFTNSAHLRATKFRSQKIHNLFII